MSKTVRRVNQTKSKVKRPVERKNKRNSQKSAFALLIRR